MEEKLQVKLNLVGLDGNAFALMAAFAKAARCQGYSQEQIDKVINECKASDYDHLLYTLMENTVSDDDSEED